VIETSGCAISSFTRTRSIDRSINLQQRSKKKKKSLRACFLLPASERDFTSPWVSVDSELRLLSCLRSSYPPLSLPSFNCLSQLKNNRDSHEHIPLSLLILRVHFAWHLQCPSFTELLGPCLPCSSHWLLDPRLDIIAFLLPLDIYTSEAIDR
jgi:hypothetical protein